MKVDGTPYEVVARDGVWIVALDGVQVGRSHRTKLEALSAAVTRGYVKVAA